MCTHVPIFMVPFILTISPSHQSHQNISWLPIFIRVFATPFFVFQPEPAEDFSHLQPHQQRRELQKKIDEVQGQVDQELKSK